MTEQMFSPALDSQQINILLAMMSVFPKYHWVWGLPSPRSEWDQQTTELWEMITAFVNQLEACLMSGCDMAEFLQSQKDLVRTQRMLVASIVGEAINFDQQPDLPNAINYEGLYSILKAQNAILDEGGITLQEMKDIIDNLDLTGTDFLDTLADIAQILTFLILLWGPTQNVHLAFTWYEKWVNKRYFHNHLTIQAHQATSLRGIMRGITPFKDDSEDDEKTLWETIGSIPWLARAVVAVAEPTPTGEIALIATTMGGIINNMFQLVKTA